MLISLVILLSFFGSSYVAKFEPSSLSNPPETTTPTLPPLFGIRTVVIDPGHGGKDPGCLGITTSQEKDIALGIALKLGKYIQDKMPDVKVIYTRSSDVFVELDERAAIANRNKADLFICIHCNTACSIDKKTKQKICNDDVLGTETYVMGLHKTNANLNVAKRENAAILLEKNYQKHYDGFDPNSETGYILLTMQQNAYLKQSMSFASKIQKQVKEKAGRVDKGVQQAGFLVLWRTAMPSVLIEAEFLSSTASEKFIVSEKGQDYLARSIFSAFRQYKDEVEDKLAKYDDDIENTVPFISEKDTTIKGTKDEGGKTREKSDGRSQKPEVKTEKDSIPANKEPVIQNETKAEIVPKDSMLTKNTMMPPEKEKLQVTIPISIENKLQVIDSIKNTSIKKTDSVQLLPSLVMGKIIYKVQFMSSGQRIPLVSDKFKGLKEVSEYEDNGSFKYTAGEFKTIDEAMKYRSEMQKKGNTDCFVVKFKDGKRMKNDK
ncbi:MAG: N-acetylmuramoyl-L-alanine amidase [Bacteroidetes bacterium]|nr:N-acetylmuramoyl-L-alanine amidase [Bacteroidota bacterium]